MSQGIIVCEPNCNCERCLSRDATARVDTSPTMTVATIGGGVLVLRAIPGKRAVYLEFHDVGGLRYSEKLSHLVNAAIRKYGWNGE